MTLERGTLLGPYEIVDLRGKGGMGEVYRARDTRLERDVAVKVLPAELARDPTWRGRLEREAKTVSRLQHPNVCTLFDASFGDGRDYLVMELLSGETLADRLGRGALPIADLVRIGIEIAEGVAAAHRLGIVHRDLKPGNVMLTATGAKVLDFGLAKGFESQLAGVDSFSPTIAQPLTTRGAIAGTLQYMSPEQLEGGEADARSDLWALGCVLYEMASGECAFGGSSAASAIASVMTAKPRPVRERREESPRRLDWLIERCLERSPERRWQSARDLALELEALGGELDQPAVRTGAVSPAPASRSLRASLELPAECRLTRNDLSMGNPLALSPAGDLLVLAGVQDGESRLWRRSLEGFEAEPISGTEGACAPFFSADGRWLGFFAAGYLQKMPTDGGTAKPICKLPAFRGLGADWAEDDRIVLPPSNLGSGLVIVQAEGHGRPQPITRLGVDQGEYQHAWPQFLPGGRHVLFTVWGLRTGGVAVVSLDSGEVRQILRGAIGGRLVAPDLLVARSAFGPELVAARFDPEALAVVGDAVAVEDDVYQLPRSGGAGNWCVARDGTLLYEPGVTRQRSLVWRDLAGREIDRLAERGPYEAPAISPDGRRVAFQWNEARSLPGRVSSGSGGDLWVHDFDRDTRERITHRGDNVVPVWSPDGAEVVFASNRRGMWNLYSKPVDGGGDARPLGRMEASVFPGAFTPDGSALWFYGTTSEGNFIGMLRGNGEVRSDEGSSFPGKQPALAPDGRHLAYAANDSGRDEVYVQPCPLTGRRFRISAEGGTDPRWAPSGREIYYRRGDQLWAVPIETESGFRPGRPRLLFTAPLEADMMTCYDIAPDGDRLLMIEREPDRPLRLVQGWVDEVRRRLVG